MKVIENIFSSIAPLKDEYKNLSKTFGEVSHTALSLEPVSKNLVDEVWGDERPSAPTGTIFKLDELFTGRSTSDKIACIREKMSENNVTVYVLTALDEIA